MAISMKCKCGKVLNYDEQDDGTKTRCPSCGNWLVVGIRRRRTLLAIASSVLVGGVGAFYFVTLVFYEPTILIFESSKVGFARETSRATLTSACEAYKASHGRYPKTLDELLLRDEFGGPYLDSPEILIDPWHKRYQYDAAGSINKGVRPDIWTKDRNGAIVGNWD
jgi:hypothetical protein